MSRFSIDRRTFEVEVGADAIDPGVRYWNYTTQTYQSTGSPAGPNPRNPSDTFVAQPDAFARFCSSTLSAPGQFRNNRTGRGYSGQIYFANEESNDEGRVFGVLTDGTTQQLPRLGQASWENSKPAYNRTDTTLVIGDEDGVAGPNSQLSIYRGTKRGRGNAFDRAGLTTEPITCSTHWTSGCRPTPSSGPGSARAIRSSSTSPRSTGTSRARVRTPRRSRPARRSTGSRTAPGIQAPERVLFPHHRGRRHDPNRAGSQPRRRRPVEGDVRGHRAARAGRHDRAPAGRLGGAVPQQAQQHGHRPARQPAAPGGPRQQRARRTDRRVRHEDGGPAAWSPSSTTICSRPAART